MIWCRPLIGVGSVWGRFKLCNRYDGVDTPVTGYFKLIGKLTDPLLDEEGPAVLLRELIGWVT